MLNNIQFDAGMILGIFIIILILPVLQTISDVFVTLGQWLISIFNLYIAKNNSIIQNCQDPVNTQAIGFQPPEPEYYDDEEEEPEEKFKVGFRS